MKIGILETGLLNDKLIDSYDSYPVMFRKLLGRAEQNFEYRDYSVIGGEIPGSIHECDGWLITGSRHGAYENLDWMLALQEFIRELEYGSVPLVGICFGHQIIAQALGGRVALSEMGWGVGLHDYQILEQPAWMQQHLDQVQVYAFHQDQVVQPPPHARTFFRSAFCRYAGLCYRDSIITIQGHPEFAKNYERALLNIYGGNIVPESVAESALNDLLLSGREADTLVLAQWLADFFIHQYTGCSSE